MRIKLFHGTNVNFDQFDQSKARILNDYWGGGVAYFTDTFDVAKTYAISMFRSRGGEKLIYEVEVSLEKTFDVDHIFTGKELQKFVTPKNSEDIARGAGLLSLGVDKYSVLTSLEMGTAKLTGAEIFKGLSAGMNRTANARKILEKMGYDSLRYNGGENMGSATRHNVYLVYDNKNITIMQKYLLDSKNEVYRK